MEKHRRYYDEAYDLRGPDDARRFYGSWAPGYDSEMIEEHGYRAPEMLADLVAERVADRAAWILDVGCGTGLVGRHLRDKGFTNIDGLDLAQEMLDEASRKNLYNRLIKGDLLERVTLNSDRYDIAVSAGTFTHNHVGPEGLDEVVRLVKPGGRAFILCNAGAFVADGYEAKLEEMSRLHVMALTETLETGPILDNGMKGRFLVLDVHR